MHKNKTTQFENDRQALGRFFRLCEKKGVSNARAKKALLEFGFDPILVDSIIPELSQVGIGESFMAPPSKKQSRKKFKPVALRSGFGADQTVELQIMPYMKYPANGLQVQSASFESANESEIARNLFSPEVISSPREIAKLKKAVSQEQRESRSLLVMALGFLLLVLAFQISKPSPHSGASEVINKIAAK